MRYRITAMLLLYSVMAFSQTKKRPGIVPDQLKLQYAGSIGFISAGAGYEWAKQKINGDLYYGFVPAGVGGVDIHTITTKFTWLPLSKTLDNHIKIDFLTAGILINYAFGKRYHLFSDTKNTFVYYGFPTAAHFAIFEGGGISKGKFGLYYELGITDKNIASFISNTKAIPFFEIVNIGLGAKYSLH